MKPRGGALSMNVAELGQAADVWAPAKVIHNEALDACSFCSINHGDLVCDASRAHYTYGSIVTYQRLCELLDSVGYFYDGYPARVKCCDSNLVMMVTTSPAFTRAAVMGVPKVPEAKRMIRLRLDHG